MHSLICRRRHVAKTPTQPKRKPYQMNNEKLDQIASTMLSRKCGVEMELAIPLPAYRDLIEVLNTAVGLKEEDWGAGTMEHWKIETDGSLRGSSCWKMMEIVAPPLEPKQMFRELKIVTDILKEFGCTVNATCGLHVHHCAKKFTAKRLQYAVNLIVKSEQAIDCLMPKSRRGSNTHWCKSNRDVLNDSINSDIGTVRRGDHWRYRKLNLTAYLKHETLEYRQHAGTIELEKIVLWMAFTQALAMRSRLKVTQNADYQNPMHNVLIQIKWATCDRDGALIPVSEIHADLCKRVVDRMTHFGFAEEAPRLAPHVAEV